MGISKKDLFRWLQIFGLGVVVILLVSLAAGAFWLNSFVRGQRMADYAAKLVERETGCQGIFEPFSFAGFGFATKGYQGEGGASSHFASIQAKGIRIEIEPFALLRGSLEMRRILIQKLTVALQKPSGGEELLAERVPLPRLAEERGHFLGRLRITSLSFEWPPNLAGGGSAKGMDLRGEGTEEGWGLRVRRGSIRVAELPELILSEAHGLLEGRTLRIEEAEFHPKNAPEALLAGTGKFALSSSETTDLSWQVQALPTGTVLPSPWRDRVTGKIRGFGKVLAGVGHPDETEGDLFLDQGSLHGIPFLLALDSLLKVRDLQDLPLSRAQCHVEGKGGWMRISAIDIQSGDTMAMNGWAEIEGKQVSGVLNVGLRSALAQRIPHLNVGLFQLGAGGYFWTTVRLSGTTDNVKEDLTPRLDWAIKKSVPMQIERKGQRLLRRVVPTMP
ncbi:hypothetical protein [Verrucomicrobium sp. 3C]|uniref:hypothetical protein n=1 Tax=Verrucomicrobium sp. 3C TaxID=1134055 RepID=UPI00037FE923|nr:hypothetical protein [Verrucomicrobium sp. 3C]